MDLPRMAQLSTITETERPGWRDLSEVASIQSLSFPRDLAYKRWMLVFFWLMPGVTFLITRDQVQITGCIIADSFHGNSRIMNIAVHPDYRNRGIGTMLMNSVILAQPSRSVILMVQEHNEVALAMYRRLGFIRTGYRSSYYGAGNPGIEMTLRRS